MPTITSGNLHAPVVMIGEKGADLIKELWLQEEVAQAEEEAEPVVPAASARKITTVYANATAA